MSNSINNFKEGVKDGIPIALGYLPVSFTFGILAVSQGLSCKDAIIISMTNLTSAGQVAGVSIIAALGSYLELAIAQFIINLRYSLMSLSLSQKLDEHFNMLHRLLVSIGITDEVFAVASAKPKEVGPKYMYGLILLPYICWVLGTLLGAGAGEILPESIKSVLGIAIYGMFIAIVIPPAKKSFKVLKVVALAIALRCMLFYIPFFSTVSEGFSIIICTVVASLVGAIFMPINNKEGTN